MHTPFLLLLPFLVPRQLLKTHTVSELLAVGQRVEVKVIAVDNATGMTKVPRPLSNVLAETLDA